MKRLERESRPSLERMFGRDLGEVRVHEGAPVHRLGAAALTVGNDIYFGPGQYAPHTPRGRGLLAHEVAHVVQEGGGSGVASRDDAAEHEAHAIGERARDGDLGRVPVRARKQAAVHLAPLTPNQVKDQVMENALKLAPWIEEQVKGAASVWAINTTALLANAQAMALLDPTPKTKAEVGAILDKLIELHVPFTKTGDIYAIMDTSQYQGPSFGAEKSTAPIVTKQGSDPKAELKKQGIAEAPRELMPDAWRAKGAAADQQAAMDKMKADTTAAEAEVAKIAAEPASADQAQRLATAKAKAAKAGSIWSPATSVMPLLRRFRALTDKASSSRVQAWTAATYSGHFLEEFSLDMYLGGAGSSQAKPWPKDDVIEFFTLLNRAAEMTDAEAGKFSWRAIWDEPEAQKALNAMFGDRRILDDRTDAKSNLHWNHFHVDMRPVKL